LPLPNHQGRAQQHRWLWHIAEHNQPINTAQINCR